MNSQDIRQVRQILGLSVSQFARVLDTDAQTVRRMEMHPDRTTHRKPAARMVRLMQAYLDGYRPVDWPF